MASKAFAADTGLPGPYPAPDARYLSDREILTSINSEKLDLVEEGHLVYRDPPCIASHGSWPKIIPPQLAPRLVAAVRSSDAYAYTADADRLHALLPSSEWDRIWSDQLRDSTAAREWKRRILVDHGAALEAKAAQQRASDRMQECLAVRVLRSYIATTSSTSARRSSSSPRTRLGPDAPGSSSSCSASDSLDSFPDSAGLL